MTKNKKNFLHTIRSLSLRYKITIPYLIVATILVGLAAYQVGRTFSSTLEEQFRGQLSGAAVRASEAVIDIEESHLAVLRSLNYTQGVPQAIAARDIDTITTLLYPQILNQHPHHVEVLDPAGQPLITWQLLETGLGYQNETSFNYAQWPITQKILARQSDEQGSTFIEITNTSQGEILYTGRPVLVDENLVGVLLVGTPLDQVAVALEAASIAKIDIYNAQGNLAASSLDGEGASLSSAIIDEITRQPNTLPTRKLSLAGINYIEAVGQLYLRGKASGWYVGVILGEDLVREAQKPILWRLLPIFGLGILAMVGLGVIVAQIIAKPVFKLVRAFQHVQKGNLKIKVEPWADDEIGFLTEGFNQMVVGLRKREFINEMFGRMVSEEVREAVLDRRVSLRGELHQVAVLFTDVRGFTSLSEEMSPNDVVSLLNEFFAIASQAVKEHQGVVNYFGGDSILAVFGAPVSRPEETSIKQAISAAWDIWEEMVVLNAKRIRDGKTSVRFGVGINAGKVVAGNIGTKERFTYTVIGDEVNVAARLQGLTREFPRTPILLPTQCVDTVSAEIEMSFASLGEFELKGKSHPVPVSALLGPFTHVPPNFDIFPDTQYPAMDAFLACYLYCVEYDIEIIAEALQVSGTTVRKWLYIAFENYEQVIPVLVAEFGLPKRRTSKLKVESLEERRELLTP